MADTKEANAVQVSESEEFDRITLGEGAPEDIMALAQSLADKIAPEKDESAEDKAKAEAEAKAKADADAKAKEEAEAKAKAEADEKARAGSSAGKDVKVEGVLLKDGKHVAPYAVLESARAETTAERERREEAEAEVKKLAAEVERLKSGKTAPGKDAEIIGAELQAKIDALRDAGVPEVAEVLDGLTSTVKALSEQVAGVSDTQRRQEAEEKKSLGEQVQDAIDRNPKLSYPNMLAITKKDARTWNRLAAEDAMLRADPDNANLTLDERFALAIKGVEAKYGEIAVPDEHLPKKQPAAGATTDADAKAKAEADAKAKAEAEAKAKKDAEDRAKAELEKAGKEKPFTLTDLPGGAATNQDDREVGQLSVLEIEQRVNAYLDKGGRIQDLAGLYK